MSSPFRLAGLPRWLMAALITSLLFLGLGLRVHQLDQRSLWVDELFTLAIAQYHPFLPEQGHPFFRRVQVKDIADGDTFLTAKAAEQSPPLYDLLEKATVNGLGSTELAARLPASVAACVLLLWFAAFAWRHPDPWVRRVLQWSLLLLALHPALVLYAKEGRAYSVGVSLLGMAGLLWMLRWRGGWRLWRAPGWVEIAFFTLACFAHYNAALLVALLLSADAVMATRLRSGQAWLRLLTLTALFSLWLFLNAHAILFTSEGGVAWESLNSWDRFVTGMNDALSITHVPWLVLVAGLWVCVVVVQWLGDANALSSSRTLAGRVLWLAVLTLVYVALAGKVAAKAGMAHPRYFIFILPFVAVMMGLVLAELRWWWQAGVAAIALIALAQPMTRLVDSNNIDDLRGMSISAVRGVNNDTVFLYPLVSNRNVYRVYLHRYLGEDPRERMLGITTAQDAAAVCERLKGRTHIVALGHDSGKSLTDAVYARCGGAWALRSDEHFHRTYTEHWRVR